MTRTKLARTTNDAIRPQEVTGTTHVRVEAAALQRLRLAIVLSGGKFQGTLIKEASRALVERAAEIEEQLKAKGTADCSENGKH